jgi:inositol polyphosphate 5-phosphatase INPP5B/F
LINKQGTDDYDTSEKKRIPAYCDRILFKNSELKLLSYKSFPEYTSSDHKPVSAVFDMNIRKFIPEKYEKVF